jgi:hypothetical protein
VDLKGTKNSEDSPQFGVPVLAAFEQVYEASRDASSVGNLLLVPAACCAGSPHQGAHVGCSHHARHH